MPSSSPMSAAPMAGLRSLTRSGKTHRGYQLENIVVYQNAQFDSFEDLLARYLDALNGTAPKVACFAVAGPINSRVRDGWITNLNWHVDASVLEARFGFDTGNAG